MAVRLQQEAFDVAAEIRALSAGRTDIGAVVTFSGICRAGTGENAIMAMTLDHYPGMAQAELESIEAQARMRWPLKAVTIIHRHGRLAPGEEIVLVATAAEHRRAAFAAAEFLMDYLKTRAPFWKREERRGGAEWIEASHQDEAAALRWEGGAQSSLGAEE
jgi:molybdopterin synthase catalytic subunit